MSKLRRSGLSKVLLTNRTWPWVALEFLLAFVLFATAAMLSPFAYLNHVRDDTLVTALLFAAGFAISGVGLGLFERGARLSLTISTRLILLSMVLSLSLSLTTAHFVFFMQPGRLSLIYGFGGALLGLLLWHIVLSWWMRSFPHRWFVLGTTDRISREVEFSLEKQLNTNGSAQIARLRLRLGAMQARHPAPEDFVQELLNEGVSDLILTQNAQHDTWVTRVAVRAMQGGIRVVDARTLFSEIFRKYPVFALDIEWAMRVGFDIQKPLKNFTKRVFDVALAALVLVFFSPLFLLIMLLIRIDSPGPIFFIQERQGRYFRPFGMVKFRSMRHASKGSFLTGKNDMRVTRIGALLRKFHFDELPQVWNIFIGDMSFVGPRPAVAATIESTRIEIPIFEIRQMLRPGLTGLAQISQGYSMDTTEEIQEKLGFDLFYIRHYSLSFDLWIIVRTAFNLARNTW